MKMFLKLISNKFTILSSLDAMGIILAFFSIILLTRVLDSKDYGEYIYYISIFAVAMNIFNFSVYQVLVKETSKGNNETPSLILANITLEFFCGIGSFIIVIGYLLVVTEISTENRDIFKLLFAIFFLGIISEFIKRALSSSFLSLNKIGSLGFVNNLNHFIYFIILLSIFYLDLTLTNFIIILSIKVVSNIISCLIMIFILNKSIKLFQSTDKIFFNIKKITVLSIFPLLSAFLSVLFYNIDLFMIKWLRVDASEIGVLYNGMKLTLLLTFITGIIGKVIYPVIAKSYNNKDGSYLLIINNYFNLYFKILLPFAAIIHFASLWINSKIFPETYYDSGYIFSVWIIFIIINSSYLPGLHILFLKNKEKIVTFGLLITVIINFTLNYLFVPQYGPVGAVWSSGIAICFNTLYTHYYINNNIPSYYLNFSNENIFSLLVFFGLMLLSFFSLPKNYLYLLCSVYVIMNIYFFLRKNKIKNIIYNNFYL